MGRLLRRVWFFIRHRQLEADLADELTIHRSLKEHELECGGLRPADARLAAARALGNATLAREDARAVWVPPWIDAVRQDVSFAFRQMRREPGVTLVIVGVLALAIGANGAIFSAIIGRMFAPDDEQPGRERTAMLSEPLWRRRFGAAREVIGRTVTIDGQPFTVIGVLSESSAFFHVLDRPLDVYVPLPPPKTGAERNTSDLSVYARLARGTTIERARAELSERYSELAQSHPETNKDLDGRIYSVSEAAIEGSRPVLLLLFASVGAVLLIGCTNIAGLSLGVVPAMRCGRCSLYPTLGETGGLSGAMRRLGRVLVIGEIAVSE